MKLPPWLEQLKGKLSSRGGRVGCDFGSDSLKVVCLARAGAEMRLQGHGLLPKQWDDHGVGAEEIVQGYLLGRDIAPKNVAMNLVDPDLLVRPMEFADMPMQDLLMAIRWNFRNEVEGALEEFQIAFANIMKNEGGKRRLMAYGVSAAGVERRQQLAKASGLSLVALEPNASALLAAMNHNLYWNQGEYLALLDIGYAQSSLLIAADGALHAYRELRDVSLNKLCELLAPGLDDVSARGIVRELMEQGTLDGLPDEARDSVSNYYISLLVSVQKVLDEFVSDHGLAMQEGVQRLFISGGGALLPDIASYMVKNLGVGTEVFNPFRKVINEADQPVQLADAPLYAVAVGLALPT